MHAPGQCGAATDTPAYQCAAASAEPGRVDGRALSLTASISRRDVEEFFRAKPKGRALLVSDCISGGGTATGVYPSIGHMLEVGEDRVVRRPGEKNFAGFGGDVV